MNQSIERFMKGRVLVLSEAASAQEAARAMYERRVGCAVVCSSEGRMAGLVTDRDIATQLVAFAEPLSTPLREIMSEPMYSIADWQHANDAVQLMEGHGLRRVPIIRRSESGQEKCVGIVTLDDLITFKLTDIDTISRIVARQMPGKKYGITRTDRREERREQTLARFYGTVTAHTYLDQAAVEKLTHFVLSTVVRRILPSEAKQLIEQLPGILKEDLLELRAGPDRSITEDVILKQMETHFGMETEEATAALSGFWAALKEFTGDSGEAGHVLAQMPPRLRELFLSE